MHLSAAVRASVSPFLASGYGYDSYVMPQPEIPGWMTADELEWLYQRARSHSQIAEIGSWKGRSTHALLSGCPGQVTAVDHFSGSPGDLHSLFSDADAVYREFLANCGRFPNLSVLRMPSFLAAQALPDAGFDMIFIDGDHAKQPALNDMEAWYPKLHPGGLFCGHDIDKPGVGDALREFFGMVPRTAAGTIWEL